MPVRCAPEPGAWLATRMVAVVDTWRIGLGPKGKTSAQALQARTSASKVASDSDLLIRQALRHAGGQSANESYRWVQANMLMSGCDRRQPDKTADR